MLKLPEFCEMINTHKDVNMSLKNRILYANYNWMALEIVSPQKFYDIVGLQHNKELEWFFFNLKSLSNKSFGQPKVVDNSLFA